VFTVLAFAGSL